MHCGLLGLPGSGNTTLFNALTGSRASGYSDKPNIGVANIPDPRLDDIARFIPPEKIVYASLRLVDIPGVPAGGAGAGGDGGGGGSGGAKKLNSFLEHVRQVDGVIHVVRCFDDGSGGGGISAVGDAAKLETELVLADLVVAEGAKDKASRIARTGEKEAKERVAALEKVAAILENGTPIRAATDLTDADRHVLRNYGMITSKPVIFVANVGEDDLRGEAEAVSALRRHAEAAGSRVVPVCAKLEAELAELDEPDRGEMLRSMGLEEPAIGPLARAAHEVLGLTTFYTAGPKEVRAWTIPIGASAPEAAGVIHSDIQRGFIRAECFAFSDLIELKSEKAIREAGRMRSEGKNYTMRDGDVVHFLFNV